MSIEKNKILIGPDDGDYLPLLDIVHKVTAEKSGGSLTIEEWGLPPSQMIPPHTHTKGKVRTTSCLRERPSCAPNCISAPRSRDRT